MMNLKSKVMQNIIAKWKIVDADSWTTISAADVLSVRGAGDSTLNKIRLYLAHRGLSLYKDNPPSYWLEILSQKPEPDSLTYSSCPFTVIVDTNETYPFEFDWVVDRNGTSIKVPVERQALWSMGLADYTIKGMELDVQLERKADDIFTSLGSNREKFEEEISRLSEVCQYAAVICEHSWRSIVNGLHTQGLTLKTMSQTVISWQVRYPGVHWWFCEGRSHAEMVAYRLLERFYWTQMYGRSKILSSSVSDLFAPIESL